MKFRDYLNENKYENLSTSDALLKLINAKKPDIIGKDKVTVKQAEALLDYYDMLDDSNKKDFDSNTIKNIMKDLKSLLDT
jgi:hypothetical protein